MIEFVRETGSTNSDLAARLDAGEFVPEGLWLVADRQTSGRGRQGRAWFDGSGNFMGSTVVHRRFGDPEPASLALLAGLAVHGAIAAHLPDTHHAVLKWPNDVMIDDAKLAGILLEQIGDTVIIGIGINLAVAPPLAERRTIALAELGIRLERNTFAGELARIFDMELERWRNFGMAPVLKRWLAAGHPIGTPLTVHAAGEPPFAGTFDGLGEDGSLQLRLADGTRRAIHAGEVSLSGPDE